MRKLYTRGLAVTAGALAAIAGGAVAVTAATSTPTSATTTPSTGSAAHAIHWHRPRLYGAVGAVVSDTGGTTGGTLVIDQPDGNQLTINLNPKAKAWKYQGIGQKRIEESATTLPVGEVVAVRYDPKQSKHTVRFVLDLGFKGSAAG